MGLHFDACDTWNDKPPADKTWENFETHFSNWVLKENKKQQAMQSAIFLANSAITNQTTELTNFLSDCVSNNKKKTSSIDELKIVIKKQTKEIHKFKIESNNFKRQVELSKNK